MAILRRPLDILKFVSLENEQFLVSLANNQEELQVHRQLQGLYDAALSNVTVHENDVAIIQMLTFTHYHFLFSTASLMRCHLSEAFASARAAIDGALIGAQIIWDRPSQIAYTKRQKPFDKLNRHLRNLINNNQPLPHGLIPALLKLHDQFSSFASHADINSFVHRIEFSNEPETLMAVQYFQFAQNESERKYHTLALLHTFVMILDVFADFLIAEQKTVPEQWRDVLHQIGTGIERKTDGFKADMKDLYPHVEDKEGN